MSFVYVNFCMGNACAIANSPRGSFRDQFSRKLEYAIILCHSAKDIIRQDIVLYIRHSYHTPGFSTIVNSKNNFVIARVIISRTDPSFFPIDLVVVCNSLPFKFPPRVAKSHGLFRRYFTITFNASPFPCITIPSPLTRRFSHSSLTRPQDRVSVPISF